MTSRDQWEALAARCAEAKGPDRDLDASIQRMIDGRAGFVDGLGYKRWWPDSSRWGYLEPVTGKIDAIVSLIEKTLLSSWHVEKDEGEFKADIWSCQTRYHAPAAASPALALCEAYCLARAELAKEGETK